MKIQAKYNKGGWYSLEVDENGTFKDVATALEIQHGLVNFAFRFIHQGKIMTMNQPLSLIKEKPVIFFLMDKIELPPKPAEPSQSETPQPPRSEQPKAESKPLPPAQKTQNPVPPRPNPQEEALKKSINEAFDVFFQLHPEQVYKPENNIWTHPAEAEALRQAALECEDVRFALYNQLMNRYGFTFQTSGRSIENPFWLLGINPTFEVETTNDVDAEIMCLSNEQKANFDRLLQITTNKKTALETFITCDYDYELTVACLTSMG